MKTLPSFYRVIISCFACLVLSTAVMSKEVNLTNQDILIDKQDGNGEQTVGQATLYGNDFRADFINGALFRRSEAIDDEGSGGGTFRNMYDVQKPGSRKEPWENGFNRNGAGDAAVAGGFVAESLITRGELVTESSGQYYTFAVDINEANSGPERFISLDGWKVYAGGSGIDLDPVGSNGHGELDPSEVTEAWGTDPLPQTDLINGTAELDAYVTSGDLDLLYDMDAGADGDSVVFLDYSSGTGSGTMDLFVFIPVGLFANTADDEMLYVFTEFGSYEFATSVDVSVDVEAGGEQIAAAANNTIGTVLLVPEPNTAVLTMFGCIFLLGRRSRSQSA